MQSHQAAGQNGRPATRSDAVGARLGSEELSAACERQVHVIETLTSAVSALRCGAAALKAENVELRAAAARIRSGDGTSASGQGDVAAALEVSLPLNVAAPGAARIVVDSLRGRVPASVLGSARLVMSELVTNSVRHASVSAGASVVVRVRVTDTMVRLEVGDPGCDGVIAPRTPDLVDGGGFGLNIVRALSERWGLERAAAGGTRVWAQLACAPRADAAGLGLAGGAAMLVEADRQPAGEAARTRRGPATGG